MQSITSPSKTATSICAIWWAQDEGKKCIRIFRICPLTLLLRMNSMLLTSSRSWRRLQLRQFHQPYRGTLQNKKTSLRQGAQLLQYFRIMIIVSCNIVIYSYSTVIDVQSIYTLAYRPITIPRCKCCNLKRAKFTTNNVLHCIKTMVDQSRFPSKRVLRSAKAQNPTYDVQSYDRQHCLGYYDALMRHSENHFLVINDNYFKKSSIMLLIKGVARFLPWRVLNPPAKWSTGINVWLSCLSRIVLQLLEVFSWAFRGS